jgi:hypothetical protein
MSLGAGRGAGSPVPSVRSRPPGRAGPGRSGMRARAPEPDQVANWSYRWWAMVRPGAGAGPRRARAARAGVPLSRPPHPGWQRPRILAAVHPGGPRPRLALRERPRPPMPVPTRPGGPCRGASRRRGDPMLPGASPLRPVATRAHWWGGRGELQHETSAPAVRQGSHSPSRVDSSTSK